LKTVKFKLLDNDKRQFAMQPGIGNVAIGYSAYDFLFIFCICVYLIPFSRYR